VNKGANLTLSELERERLDRIERNIEIFKAGEESRKKWESKIDRALFGEIGKSNEAGMVNDVKNLIKFKNNFVKVLLWITALIIAPILGILGWFSIQILAHADKIMQAIDGLK